jgi:hypothetical protein
MPTFGLAHVHEQDQDMIIFPLESRFRYQPQSDQQDELAASELQANSAGAKKDRQWPYGMPVAARMGFLGPRPWPPFLTGRQRWVVRLVADTGHVENEAA